MTVKSLRGNVSWLAGMRAPFSLKSGHRATGARARWPILSRVSSVPVALAGARRGWGSACTGRVPTRLAWASGAVHGKSILIEWLRVWIGKMSTQLSWVSVQTGWVRRAGGMGGRAYGLGGRADGLGGRADGLGGRADGLGGRADGLGGRADGLGGRADGLGGRADGLGKRADGLGGRGDGLGGRGDGGWVRWRTRAASKDERAAARRSGGPDERWAHPSLALVQLRLSSENGLPRNHEPTDETGTRYGLSRRAAS